MKGVSPQGTATMGQASVFLWGRQRRTRGLRERQRMTCYLRREQESTVALYSLESASKQGIRADAGVI